MGESYTSTNASFAPPQYACPHDENPPDLTVGEDDILFLDLGPVFEE
jgi:hypothetical protein